MNARAQLTRSANGAFEGWRAPLASVPHRREIAAGLRRLVELAAKSSTQGVSNRVPLRRPEIQRNCALLLALAQDLEQPRDVEPNGVRLASRLVSDVSSPAFAIGPQREELHRAVSRARTALQLAERSGGYRMKT
jgi:hypothetical protein